MDAAELRRSFGLSASAFVIGTVCRLDDDGHKRVSDLIRAVAMLPDLPVELLIVGDGRQRRDLERLSEELAVSGRVRFAGYREDVGAAYAVMDVFALVSAREGFGLVVAEAMLARLPVIATAVGGLRNIVEDGRTGILVPPCSAEQVRDAISRLHGEPELRSAYAEAGRSRALLHFSAERYARDVSAFYQRLLAN
jgi:glycosyltransferase involved in cell wall biosynthesis